MSTTVGPTRTWYGGLPPATRDALKALYAVLPWGAIAIGPAAAGWLAGGALAIVAPHWAVRLTGYVVAGIALHALGILMHEAIHGNLFRQQRLDRVAAFLLGAPVLVSGAAYRVSHLAHHRHTRGPEDPDELENHIRDPRLLSLAFYLWAFFGMFAFLTHVPRAGWRLGTLRDRRRIAAEYAILVTIYTTVLIGAARLNAWPLLLHGWAAPLGIAFMIVNLRGWTEHMLTRTGHPLWVTRTITSNRAVSLLLLNLNYHLEHHLFPGVPWYNLPRVHAVLRSDFRAAGAPIMGSYIGFLWAALRQGPHRALPSPASETETRGRLRRILGYIRVMFPPGRMVPTGAALFLSVYLGLQAVTGTTPLRVGWPAAIGIASTVLWMLLVRLNDDLTDVRADQALAAAGDPRYQHRPTVTGAVTLGDLRVLSSAGLVTLLGINLVFGLSVPLAACVAGWAITWLGFRWFFVPRWARDPGPLAYLARKGLTVLVSTYAAAVYLDQAGRTLTWWAVPLLVAPCAGVAAWEVGRKIRLPEDETAYPTYSLVLGWRRATALAAGFVATSWVMLMAVSGAAAAGTGYSIVLTAAALLALSACVRLLARPAAERTRLDPWMQVYGAVAHGGLAVALALRLGLEVG